MKRPFSRLRIAFFALIGTSVLACSWAPSGPYTVRHDSAPLRSIAPEQVLDAVPVADPITSAGNTSPYRVRGKKYYVLKDASGYRERGTASWYGAKFHGHKTANGEIYDLYRATAAHKTLPIPSYVRVTNLANNLSIIVRVNDRGPFHPDRVIDLSYAAAVKLGYVDFGTAEVDLEIVNVSGVDDRRGSPGGDHRFLQVGAFGVEASAKELRTTLAAVLATPVFVSPVLVGKAMLYRVRVGPVADGDGMARIQQQLAALGYAPGQPVP
ncbi:MAG: septal ring lytic transglycosylase RlpA family protein [Halioglobus sp.]